MEAKLKRVRGVYATSEPDVFILDVDVNYLGSVMRCDFCSRPDDPHGLNPQVREWLATKPHTVKPAR